MRRGMVHPQVHPEGMRGNDRTHVEDLSGLQIPQDIWHIDNPEEEVSYSSGNPPSIQKEARVKVLIGYMRTRTRKE